MQTRTLLAQGLAPLFLSVATSTLALPQIAAAAESGTLDTALNPGMVVVAKGDTFPADVSDSANSAGVRYAQGGTLPDLNRNSYYKNRLETSVETGWLPNNVPFIFDFLVGSKFTAWPLPYTLVPNISSLRWQIDNPWGWKPLRGSTEFSFSGSYTAIPRGPETRYFAFDYGIRRYFVQPRCRIVPYVEGRGGVGDINAKGPHGVLYAQGQDLTFTLIVGSGARYNLTPRYGVSAGMAYMHVSNFYLSEPRYENFGINVYGVMSGVYMRLGKARQTSVH